MANPNGISMSGAGFVNVSRFTAVVGSSNQFNPNPGDLTFSLSSHAQVNSGFLPKLTIAGTGLDLESVSSTDLVANLMNVVAPIYGGNNEVNLRAGDKQFDYATKQVTSDNSHPANNSPTELAIDASSLAKVQAGKIYMIATKEGFGIKWSADLLAQRAGVNVDAAGNIYYGNIASVSGNIEVTSRKGSIEQNGIAQTTDVNSDIKLNAFDNITNYGQFLSARDISLETKKTFNNQSLLLNLSDNDFTIKARDVVNSGMLSAHRDLSIEAAATLINSKALIGGRDLTLKANQITNYDSIGANNKVIITANDFLTNNKDITSLGTSANDGVTINAKTLNNNKQIAAKNSITINSGILNNNTADSLILAFNDINLNTISLDNTSASIQAGNNLTLRNLTLTTPDIASLFSLNAKGVNITNTDGSFSGGSSLDFDLGNSSTYNITGKLASTGFIKLKANDITNQGSVSANDYIKVDAGNNFTNGALSVDNSNVKFIAGTYLYIAAANLVSNYGTLSSKTDLTLTSTNGDINNNRNAEIIGGTGKLKLIAKNGTVNQNSLHSIVVNGDYSLDALNFVNTGRVDVAGNLTLNVANDLTNEENAMIYSGNDMILNVNHNLTNKSGAAIFAWRNLTIQKRATTDPLYDSLNNRINKLENISGEITSYTGDMTLRADTIENKRLVDPFNKLINPGGGVISSRGRGIDNLSAYTWVWNNNGCFGTDCGGYYDGYYAKQLTNPNSIASTISSGGKMEVEAKTLTNSASSITAVGNMIINADTLKNETISNPGLYYTHLHPSGWDDNTNYFTIYSLAVEKDGIYRGIGNGSHSGSYLNARNYAQSFNATIKSGGSITGVIKNDISNEPRKEYANDLAVTKKDPAFVNSKNIDNILKDGIIDVNLTNYLNGPDTQGMFIKNPNPNAPLFETRSQFIDQSKFFGSNYFYQRIGLNLTDVQTQLQQQDKRMIGDQFFQTKIIEEQLRTITKNSFLLSSSETSVNNEIQNLLNNAADEYTRLGLNSSLNKSLTQSQINNLQKDVIWFETQTINGQAYIVPKIYLSQATRDRLQNTDSIATKSTIYAKQDVNLTSTNGGITNNGSIIGNNVTLSANQDIVNKNFSDITSLTNLSLTSTAGSIANFSNLKANGALSLNAAKDVTNSATVATNDSNLLNSGNSAYKANRFAAQPNSTFIESKLIETAGISAGSLTINAGNNFNNQGANITVTKNDLGGGVTSSGNASITAGNDVNIGTVVLRNRTEASHGHTSNGGNTITDKLTNVGSDVNTQGNLQVSTGRDTAILGSNVTTGENATVNTGTSGNGGSFTLASVQDTYHTDTWNKKKGGMFGGSKSSSSSVDQVTSVGSNFTSGGSLSVNAGTATSSPASAKSSIVIAGSEAKSINGDVSLAAKNNINIVSAENYSATSSSSSKKGATSKSFGNDHDQKWTQVSSNIKASNGTVNMMSGDDTNIIASNAGGKNGNILVGKYTDPLTLQTIYNKAAQLNIKSGQNVSDSYHEMTRIKTDSTAVVVGAVAAVAVTVASGGVGAVVLAGAAAGGGMVGAQGKKGDSVIERTTEVKQVASNLTFTSNLNIQSASNTNITSSNLSADSGTILTGKFRSGNDKSSEVVVNSDAKLNRNSAFDTTTTIRESTSVSPNYMGIALVAGASAWLSYQISDYFTSPIGATGPQLPIISAGLANGIGIAALGSGIPNASPDHKSLLPDVLFNLRDKGSSSKTTQTEVKTNLNFRDLKLD